MSARKRKELMPMIDHADHELSRYHQLKRIADALHPVADEQDFFRSLRLSGGIVSRCAALRGDQDS
jgi:hypothetical protein